MRAMVLSQLAPIETKPLELRLINKHKISGPYEVLIKIEACGVCRSQLHGIEGDWRKYNIPPKLPVVPGHEIVGRIVDKGELANKFNIGQKAGVSPLRYSCMKCMYCNNGKENLCESADITGESLMGGYSEYITVNEDFATFVPDEMKSEYAAPLFCAGLTAYKAIEVSEPNPGAIIGIFGIGGVGHMAIQFANIHNCKAIAISRSYMHLDVAKNVGAFDVIRYNNDKSVFLDNLKRSAGILDSAIVFAPSENVVDIAIRSVKRGGTIVIGTFTNIPSFNVSEEKTIRGTLIGTRNDMNNVIKIAKDKKLTVVVEKYRLENANEVLVKLKNSNIKARAVLIP